MAETHDGPTLDGATYSTVWLSEVHNAGRLEWQTPQTSSRALCLEARQATTKVFPASIRQDAYPVRPQPKVYAGDIYAQGHFLDKRYFDFHIPKQILIEGIANDLHVAAAEPTRYGTLVSMAMLPFTSANKDVRCILASRTGSAGRTLTVMRAKLVLQNSKKGTRQAFEVDASRRAEVKFPTAILEVYTAFPASEPFVAVRTATSITVLEVGSLEDDQVLDLTKPYTVLDSSSMRGFQPADLCLSPFAAVAGGVSLRVALCVDVTGGIWEIARSGQQGPAQLRTDQMRAGNPGGGRSGFAKITYGIDEHQAVVALEDAVRIFDFHDPDNDRNLFLGSVESGRILDMAKPSQQGGSASLRVLVTEKQVIWLDLLAQTPSAVGLRYQHHLVAKAGLRVSTMVAHELLYTILWSFDSPVCMVLATSTTSPVRMLAEPHDLGSPTSSFKRTGLDLLYIPANKYSKKRGHGERVILSETGEDGSLYQREVIWPSMLNEEAVLKIERTWDASLLQLDRSRLDPEPSNLDARKQNVADWRKIYADIFNATPSLHSGYPFVMPLRARDVEAGSDAFQLPIELVTSAADTSEDVHAEQGIQSAFSSKKALDAASVLMSSVDGEYDELSLHATSDFGFRLPELLPDLGPDGTARKAGGDLVQTYKSAQMMAEDETLARRALTFACGQVATDLALSRDVYGPHRPAEPDPDEVDETMLSYDSQWNLPKIEYGFFKPVQLGERSAYDHPAAQALLSEWKLGANPSLRPPFENPYDEAKMQERLANKQFEAYRSRIAGGMDISASQPMPSTRGESKARPKQRLQRISEQDAPIQSQPQPQASSQTQGSSQPASQTQTQAPAPMFSQVVPGAHGGRPAKKKRVGGF